MADGRADALAALLSTMGEQGAAHNETLPVADLPGVHFARLFVLEETVDPAGERIESVLFYMADVDDTGERHLRDLATVGGSGVDTVFAHCQGYPDAPDVRARLAWLRDHSLEPAARYVHSVGRSVDQVRQEARLREDIEDFLDAPAAVPAGLTAAEAHRRIRSFVTRRDDLRWAGAPARPPGLRFRLREKAHRVALPLAVVVLLPVLVPVALVLIVLVRLAERRDVPESGPPGPEQVAALERLEDHVAQNPFTAVGFVKPGRVRRLVMRGVLLGLDYADRHVYNHDNLRGVRTIHFARWLPIDEGRRLIFCSSYDGTLESYMDDFIDRLAWGLNAVFSNGVGYPSTRWLVLDGARDEVAFKSYLRRHQVPNPVWYSAYDTLPARNIDTNERLRADLTRVSDEQEAAAWLELV